MPVHRRVLVLLVAAGWAAFEGYYEPNSIWFLMALGIVAWGAWDFFLSGNYARRSE